MQNPHTTICPGTHEPPPQSSKRWVRGGEIDQLINVVRLSGPIVMDLIPKPQPAVPRTINAALEVNAKVLIVEIELVRASGTPAAPDAAPAQQLIDVQSDGVRATPSSVLLTSAAAFS